MEIRNIVLKWNNNLMEKNRLFNNKKNFAREESGIVANKSSESFSNGLIKIQNEKWMKKIRFFKKN